MLNLYSHTTLPVSASSAITRSWRSGPRPDGFCTYTRLPITIGADRPPYGTRQRKFWPFNAHFSGRPVSFEMPSRFGPRASGQSPIAIPRGCWADVKRPAPRMRAKTKLQDCTMAGLQDGKARIERAFRSWALLCNLAIMPSCLLAIPLSCHPAFFAMPRSESHARAQPECPRRARFADESRRRQAGIRQRYGDVPSVEGIADPHFAERAVAAQSRAQVRQRVRVLAHCVRVVVLVVAVADRFGACRQRQTFAQRTRVLDAEIRRVARRIRQRFAAHVDAVGEAAVRETRVREPGAAEQIHRAIRPGVQFELDAGAARARGIPDEELPRHERVGDEDLQVVP